MKLFAIAAVALTAIVPMQSAAAGWDHETCLVAENIGRDIAHRRQRGQSQHRAAGEIGAIIGAELSANQNLTSAQKRSAARYFAKEATGWLQVAYSNPIRQDYHHKLLAVDALGNAAYNYCRKYD